VPLAFAAVRRVSLPRWGIADFGSSGVSMTAPARVAADVSGFAVDIATFEAAAVLGRHETRLWQLFALVSGEGWASGTDGVRMALAAGDAVLWEPGEMHETGTDTGMVAVIVQSPVNPVSCAPEPEAL
jgi:quercetin dioxygenase-like cupin family protein